MLIIRTIHRYKINQKWYVRSVFQSQVGSSHCLHVGMVPLQLGYILVFVLATVAHRLFFLFI